MKKCGTIAIIGRPNMGKSTLLNHLLRQKVSITSRKPQTTRHQILGVLTEGETQFIFVDTPGMHQKQTNLMNRYLNRAAFGSLADVDVVLWLIEPTWNLEDDWILERLQTLTVPLVLAINKVDLVKDKKTLLPLIESLKAKKHFAKIIPISAKQSVTLPPLLEVLSTYLPEQEWIFPEDTLTDKPVRFLVAEIIREKLMRLLGDELPYQTAVEIEAFKETQKLTDISAVIYVERDSQKKMVVGHHGSKVKQIGISARQDIEVLLDQKVMLRLFVKVKENWGTDAVMLKSLGYGN